MEQLKKFSFVAFEKHLKNGQFQDYKVKHTVTLEDNKLNITAIEEKVRLSEDYGTEEPNPQNFSTVMEYEDAFKSWEIAQLAIENSTPEPQPQDFSTIMEYEDAYRSWEISQIGHKNTQKYEYNVCELSDDGEVFSPQSVKLSGKGLFDYKINYNEYCEKLVKNLFKHSDNITDLINNLPCTFFNDTIVNEFMYNLKEKYNVRFSNLKKQGLTNRQIEDRLAYYFKHIMFDLDKKIEKFSEIEQANGSQPQ